MMTMMTMKMMKIVREMTRKRGKRRVRRGAVVVLMRMRLRDWTFLMGMMDFYPGRDFAKVLTIEKSKLAAKKVLERRSNKVRNQTDDMMLRGMWNRVRPFFVTKTQISYLG